MKSAVFIHHLEFSQHDFCIAIGDTFKLAAAAAQKQRGLAPVLPIGEALASAHVDAQGAVILLKTAHLTIPTIVHEVTHITNNILLSMGIKLCDESDEAYAYHNDMLMMLIMKWLERIGITPDPY